MTCRHCPVPGKHRVFHGGTDMEVNLCCLHADLLMERLRDEVPEEEGERGWAKWLRAHRAECGPRGAVV